VSGRSAAKPFVAFVFAFKADETLVTSLQDSPDFLTSSGSTF